MPQPPVLSVSATELDFGEADTGGTFTISNDGGMVVTPLIEGHEAVRVLGAEADPDNAADRIRKPVSGLGDRNILRPVYADTPARVIFLPRNIRACFLPTI
jgi:hypothetical protein